MLGRGLMLPAALVILVSCGRAEHHAEYGLPDSALVLAVDLRQSHPFLAEYDRELSIGPADGPRQSIELFPDSGGYALVNLYRAGPSAYLIKTMGNDEYFLDLESGHLTRRSTGFVEQQNVPVGAEFIGAFDFSPAEPWRFIPAAERPERRIGEISIDR